MNTQRQKLALIFPELASQLAQEDANALLKELSESNKGSKKISISVDGKAATIKGDKGEKGDRGDIGETGKPGKDGRDGKDGKNGSDGENGKDGIDGKRGPAGLDGLNGKNGKDGKDGKDAEIDLSGYEKRLSSIEKSSTLKPKGAIDQRWHGGGLSKVSTDSTLSGLGTPSSPLSVVGGGGFTTLLPTETPNGSLTVFTFSLATAQPSFIVSDNAMMQATTKSGTVNWTWNNGTKKATMTIPPSDDIIAIK